MTVNRPDAVAIIVVTHQSSEHLATLAETISGQLQPGDEMVIVDNASTDDTVLQARALFPAASIIDTGENRGFAAGCHIGVNATDAPLLLFLNPDSRPATGCMERLRSAASLHPDWSAWQAAVLIDEEHVNTSGGVVHYLGIGWAGDCGAPVSTLSGHKDEIAFPSGAAMVVRRNDWLALKGMDADYFMYGEDLDFGLRLWLSGRRVGFVADARVFHDYEFDKGTYKWYWLERNRWLTVLSVYPLALLVLLAPALLTAELGLLAVAARGGWLSAKVRAQIAAIRAVPTILRRRKEVQATRCIGAASFACHLTASLDNPYLGSARSSPLSALQAAHWRMVQSLLLLSDRSRQA